MDLKPRKRDWTSETDRLYDPYLNISSFEDLVQAASNGLNVHHSVTPTTHKAIKEASQLAAFTPTPNSSAEDKKVWDKFVDFARQKGFTLWRLPNRMCKLGSLNELKTQQPQRQSNLSYSVSENGDTLG